jgi:hypothetical protein
MEFRQTPLAVCVFAGEEGGAGRFVIAFIKFMFSLATASKSGVRLSELKSVPAEAIPTELIRNHKYDVGASVIRRLGWSPLRWPRWSETMCPQRMTG